MDEQTQPAEPILVADDDAHILELVAMYLRRAGYHVETAADGDETLRKERELKPSLLVLDIMMPGHDGIQILRTLRKRSTVPIIFLTARTSDIDKIAGLRLGADDYVTKPFNPEELVARVESVLRRVNTGAPERPESPEIHIDDVEVDLDKRAVTVAGRDVSLTPKEFDLLATFARFPNVVLDREQILDLVWGTSFYAVRTVDVHVARLRDKLQKSKLRIETVWGTGYRLATGEH
jgi:DNA-binding response OmpR family regulator